MMAGITEHSISLSDHTTTILTTGTDNDSTPIVLLHSNSMDSHIWTLGFIQSLSALNPNRRIVAYDIRGHGSAVSAPATTSLSQLANDLREVLGHIKANKADIVGVSYGGFVAQGFAIEFPHLVRSVALIATLPKGSSIMIDRAVQAEELGSVAPLADENIARWFTSEAIERNAECVAFARGRMNKVPLSTWSASWRTLGTADMVDGLGKIDVPVLVLAGTHDQSTPPALMKVMAGHIEKCTYQELEVGKHLFAFEYVKETVAVVQKHLDSVQR